MTADARHQGEPSEGTAVTRQSSPSGGRRSPAQRRADRARGVDRHGNPLPRTLRRSGGRADDLPTAGGQPEVGGATPGWPAPDASRPIALTHRWRARAIECPVCGAEPGQDCHGPRGPRKRVHADRHAVAIELGAPVVRTVRAADLPETSPLTGHGVTRQGGEAERAALDTGTRVGHADRRGLDPAA